MSILRIDPAFIESSLEGKNPLNGSTLRYNSTLGVLEVSDLYSFQGSVSGYSSGGGPPATYANIDKFPFAADTNASFVGSLTVGRGAPAGQSSTVSGYTSGGITFGPTITNVIDKFPFATNTNATDVGDLAQTRNSAAGQSSTVSGYVSGGFPGPISNINKFPFASNANATNIGFLTQIRGWVAGQTSIESGYTSGGNSSSGAIYVNTIDKFPFASDGNATDVGDLTGTRTFTAGQSSSSYGYNSGNGPSIFQINTIDKFPFSTNANASDVGDLSQGRFSSAGQSSIVSGYTSGGGNPWPSFVAFNTVDKFPFVSDSNATDVGDLFSVRSSLTGQQV